MKMNIQPQWAAVSAAVLLVVSGFAQYLIFVGKTPLPFKIDLLLTAGMVGGWLLSSRYFKEMHQAEGDWHPLRLIGQYAPFWLSALTVFFLLYAVLNMGMMIRTRWEGSNLRGVSGFWLFFYALTILVGYARWNQLRTRAQNQRTENQ